MQATRGFVGAGFSPSQDLATQDRRETEQPWQKSSKKRRRTPEQQPGKPAAATKRKKEFKKKRERRVIPHGLVHIAASFNNTQISITDTDGRIICWSSAGAIGFKGSRKGTPYAAQQASLAAAGIARDQYGMKSVEVRVKGPGSGRESAVRALAAAGFISW